MAGTGLLFTAFVKLEVPAGTRLIMQPLAGFSSCQHGGNGWARPQTF